MAETDNRYRVKQVPRSWVAGASVVAVLVALACDSPPETEGSVSLDVLFINRIVVDGSGDG